MAGGAPSSEAGAGGEGEPPIQPSCDPIVFEDPALEEHVALSVGKTSGPLTSADVAGLTYLLTNDASSLVGVECLTSLTDLDISVQPAGKVTDLSPLAGLHELTAVSVGRNPLKSLEPLGKLPKLEYLFVIHATTALDLSPLAESRSLTYVDLEGDSVVDLAPLGSIPTLSELRFRRGHVLHPEGASALTNVKDFDATDVFDDVTPLAGLVRLERLRVSQRPIEGFDSLSGLVNLRLLDVTRTGVDSLAPVAGMKHLAILGAVANAIRDVTPLAGLHELQSVALVDNDIVDVSSLAQNPGIDAGDFVYLQDNALPCPAQRVGLDAMRARGATVESDCE